MFNAGFVALVGKPNAGKSSLTNALIGEKVAIVSSKPQTTRDNIMGIKTTENYQMVFVDTPGVHRSKNLLDKSMMKNVRSALAGVDLVLYLISDEGSFFNGVNLLCDGGRNVMSLGADAKEMAHRLFDELRSADEMGARHIFSEAVPGEGIGLAVMNRLGRAAAFNIEKI